MAAIGIVLRQHLKEFEIVSEYYAAAPREPTLRGNLAVDRVDPFDSTFKGLAAQILAYRRSHVVVVAHGNPSQGLIMGVAPKSKVAAGLCIPKLVRLTDALDAVNGSEAKLDQKVLADVAAFCKLSNEDTLSIARICRKVRHAKDIAVAVHIRGCDIGYDVNHLIAFRRLFNSAVVSAPNCPMWFSGVRPEPKTAEKYAKAHPRPHGRRVLYESTGLSPLLLDILYSGASASMRGALGIPGDLQAWAAIFKSKVTSGNYFPIAGMWPKNSTRYWCAHETAGYTGCLVANRAS